MQLSPPTRSWTAAAMLLVLGMAPLHGDGGIGLWEELGPGNIGGRIRSIVVHPSNKKIMYVGSLGGGVWKTTNEGRSWFPTGDDMGNMQVSTLVMDPSNPGTLYAGTGEGFARRGGRRDGKPGDGVFRTTNAGLSWQQLPGTVDWRLDTNRFVNRVSVSPSDPQRLLVGTDQGLYLSTDGGTNFTLQYAGRVVDVKFNPNDGQRAVAGLEPDGRGVPASGHHDCVIYSDDGGWAWTPSVWAGRAGITTLSSPVAAGDDTIVVGSSQPFFNNDVLQIGSDISPDKEYVQINDDLSCEGQTIRLSRGLINPHAAGTSVLLVNAQRTEVAWAPSTPNTVYASVGSGGGTVWRSINGGASFSFRSNPNGQGDGGTCGSLNYLDYLTFAGSTRRAFYNNLIWVAPDDPNLVVVGGLELLRSTDGGRNFSLISDRFGFHLGTSVHSDHHAFAAHTRYGVVGDPDRYTVFSGNDGGIQRNTAIRTVTPSSTWSNIGSNSLAITEFYAGAASRDGNYLLGAAQDLDLLSRGAGQGALGWFNRVNAGDGYGCAIDDRNPSAPVFYRFGNGIPVGKSLDLGRTYQPATNGLNFSETFLRGKSYAYAMDPNNAATLVLGMQSIWISLDSAGNWAQLYAQIAGSPACTALAMVRGDSSILWAGYDDGSLHRTSVSLLSWTALATGGLPSRRVNSIAINPADATEVLVAFTEPSDPSVPYDAVWFTDDNGARWQPRFGAGASALPAHQVNTVVYHPTRANWVYAGTDVGVYASEDGGLNWARTPLFDDHEGPANTSVQDLFWDGQNRLYAATYGRGLFRVRVYTSLYVNGAYSGTESGTLSQPFNTVREGLRVTGNGTSVYIEGGTYDESGTVQFERRGDIRGRNGAVTIR